MQDDPPTETVNSGQSVDLAHFFVLLFVFLFLSRSSLLAYKPKRKVFFVFVFLSLFLFCRATCTSRVSRGSRWQNLCGGTHLGQWASLQDVKDLCQKRCDYRVDPLSSDEEHLSAQPSATKRKLNFTVKSPSNCVVKLKRLKQSIADFYMYKIKASVPQAEQTPQCMTATPADPTSVCVQSHLTE